MPSSCVEVGSIRRIATVGLLLITFALVGLWYRWWFDDNRKAFKYNSRTIHLEEYLHMSPLSHPQSVWGVVWPMKAQHTHGRPYELFPVLENTCLASSTTHSSFGKEENVYKDGLALCGPAFWHSAESCQISDSGADKAVSNSRMNAYLDLLNMQVPQNDDDRAEAPFRLFDNSRYCTVTKLKSIVGFENDSRSYSFLSSGNSMIYWLCSFLITSTYLGRNLSSVKSDGINSDVDWRKYVNVTREWMWVVIFSGGYITFLVVWATNLRGSETSILSLYTDETSPQEFVYTNDSCHGSVLLAWLLFSFYTWLSRTSDALAEAKDTEMDDTPMSSVAISTIPPAVELSAQPFNSKTNQFGALILHNEVLTDTGMMDFFGTQFPFIRLDPLFWNPCLAAHRVALLELFLFPLFVCIAAFNDTKYDLDINIQEYFIAGLAVAFLQYCATNLNWTFHMASHVEHSPIWLNRVGLLVTAVVVATQLIILLVFAPGTTFRSGFWLVWVLGGMMILRSIVEWGRYSLYGSWIPTKSTIMYWYSAYDVVIVGFMAAAVLVQQAPLTSQADPAHAVESMWSDLSTEMPDYDVILGYWMSGRSYMQSHAMPYNWNSLPLMNVTAP